MTEYHMTALSLVQPGTIPLSHFLLTLCGFLSNITQAVTEPEQFINLLNARSFMDW